MITKPLWPSSSCKGVERICKRFQVQTPPNRNKNSPIKKKKKKRKRKDSIDYQTTLSSVQKAMVINGIQYDSSMIILLTIRHHFII